MSLRRAGYWATQQSTTQATQDSGDGAETCKEKQTDHLEVSGEGFAEVTVVCHVNESMNISEPFANIETAQVAPFVSKSGTQSQDGGGTSSCSFVSE